MGLHAGPDGREDFARAVLPSCSRAVRSLPLLSGFCYTQFTDTYQEANGLLYMDRTPKFPLEEIATATRGHERPRSTRSRRRGARKGSGQPARVPEWSFGVCRHAIAIGRAGW